MKIPDRSRPPAGQAAGRAPSHFKDSLSYDESIGQCRPAYPMMSRVHWTVQAAEWRQPGLEGYTLGNLPTNQMQRSRQPIKMVLLHAAMIFFQIISETNRCL